jgi:hypothetical protein
MLPGLGEHACSGIRRLLIAHPLYPLCATGSPHLARASIRGRYALFASCSTAGLPMMSLLIPEEGSQRARNRVGTRVAKYVASSLVQHQWVKLSRQK